MASRAMASRFCSMRFRFWSSSAVTFESFKSMSATSPLSASSWSASARMRAW